MKDATELKEELDSEEWQDVLNLCPSQCKLNFSHGEILLYWRHMDPWEAWFIDNCNDWQDLDIGYWKQEDDLKTIKEICVNKTIEYLTKGK